MTSIIMHLHSTLVSLIPEMEETYSDDRYDLHSTLVSLIHSRQKHIFNLFIDLHSTLVSLIPINDILIVQKEIIYIPLWLV